MNKVLRLFNIIIAFSKFQGLPLAALDVSESLLKTDYDRIESCLGQLASELCACGNPQLREAGHQIKKQLRGD